MKRLLALVALALASLPAVARGQQPWAVTITPTLNPVPIGGCGAVWLDVKDASGKDAPRNRAGWRVGMADFDLTVSSPDGKSAAGQYHGASSFAVCGCQGATVGTVATVTATYPSKWIAPKALVPDVTIRVSAPVAIGKAQGSWNAPECSALKSQSVASAPAAVSPGASVVPAGAAMAPGTLVAAPLGTATMAGAPMSSGAAAPVTSTRTPVSEPKAPVSGGTLAPSLPVPHRLASS